MKMKRLKCLLVGALVSCMLTLGIGYWALLDYILVPQEVVTQTAPPSPHMHDQLVPDITLITEEGYIAYLTANLSTVQMLCSAFTPGQELTNTVLGCARWNYEAEGEKHDPNGPCFIVSIYGTAPDGENVLEHELRHCREGFFHEGV